MISDPFCRAGNFGSAHLSLDVSHPRFSHSLTSIRIPFYGMKPLLRNCFESEISNSTGFRLAKSIHKKCSECLCVCLRACGIHTELMVYKHIQQFRTVCACACMQCNNHLTENLCNPCENNSSSCVLLRSSSAYYFIRGYRFIFELSQRIVLCIQRAQSRVHRLHIHIYTNIVLSSIRRTSVIHFVEQLNSKIDVDLKSRNSRNVIASIVKVIFHA